MIIDSRFGGQTLDAELTNVGQADAPDVLQAEVEAEQAGIDCTQAQRAFIGAFYTLASVSGKPELPVSPLNGDLEQRAAD